MKRIYIVIREPWAYADKFVSTDCQKPGFEVPNRIIRQSQRFIKRIGYNVLRNRSILTQ